ncbi:MAG: LPP20 family lipoprotein [Helicobacteraceae bacterium]|jgi:ABC-type enterochelin transport system substrate-binding protein|nr:LPP20 family lipoprotein [Helicobacteraceae bacterium]
MSVKVTLMAVALLLLAGCGKTTDLPEQAECQIDSEDAPVWVCIPDGPDGWLGGLGTASRNPAGDYGFQLRQAQASGRDDITRQVELKVQNMFKSWQRSTAQGVPAATFENDYEGVSRQTAELSLRGSKVGQSWQAKNGTLYVLMVAPIDQAQQGLMSSLQNREALWQQFQSQKAQEELKAEFDKEFR